MSKKKLSKKQCLLPCKLGYLSKTMRTTSTTNNYRVKK